ncbi:MAG: hypothetical protein QXV37_04420 [Candidatus Jordarchaeaceae archaeon]
MGTLFLSKKGKVLKENYWDKSENIENMTKILFEEVSNLDRRFKILEQQVKAIMQDLYGFRKIVSDDTQERIDAVQKLASEVKTKKEDLQLSPIAKEPSPPARVAPISPSSKNLFSPYLPPPQKKDVDSPPLKRFASSSPSESAHPPTIVPTFPSSSQNKDKEREDELAQKDTTYHMIPRVKLATKTRTN